MVDELKQSCTVHLAPRAPEQGLVCRLRARLNSLRRAFFISREVDRSWEIRAIYSASTYDSNRYESFVGLIVCRYLIW